MVGDGPACAAAITLKRRINIPKNATLIAICDFGRDMVFVFLSVRKQIDAR